MEPTKTGSPSRPSSSAMGLERCRLCGSAARLKFSLPLAHGLTGEYFGCTACEFLHSAHLDDKSALNVVYSKQDNDSDAGAAWRQFCVVKRVRQLALWRAFGLRLTRLNALDVGSGSGFVPAFLAHHLQWNAIGYEPYSRAAYAPKLQVADWETVAARAPFDVVTATEVLEHFRDPVRELRRIVSVMHSQSFLYVTTGAYDPGTCDEKWPYLAPETAQHCSFYSPQTLARVADVIAAPLVLQLGRGAEWLFVRGAVSPLRRARLRATAALIRATTRSMNRIG